MPPYLVPNSSGGRDHPSLSGFYMFFTMIILLQVFTMNHHCYPEFVFFFLPVYHFPSFRSWFPFPSTSPLSWWRSARSSSSLMTWICTMKRPTAASSASPWTSQRTWGRSNTSSQTRLALWRRTRWCFADAPSWAQSTHTKRTVILHTTL